MVLQAGCRIPRSSIGSREDLTKVESLQKLLHRQTNATLHITTQNKKYAFIKSNRNILQTLRLQVSFKRKPCTALFLSAPNRPFSNIDNISYTLVVFCVF